MVIQVLCEMPSHTMHYIQLIGQRKRAPQQGVARHKGDSGDATRLQHARKLLGSSRPIGWIRQMIERPQAQHCVKAGIRPTAEVAGVSFNDRFYLLIDTCSRDLDAGNCEQLRREVGEYNLVAMFGKPDRLEAWPAAKI